MSAALTSRARLPAPSLYADLWDPVDNTTISHAFFVGATAPRSPPVSPSTFTSPSSPRTNYLRAHRSAVSSGLPL
jgi:hypothetical protein